MSLKDKLQKIDPSRSCLTFLAERICSNNYRGIQISQHNRYTCDDVIVMLEELYKSVGTEKMVVRTTDLRKRPYNEKDEEKYALYTKKVVDRMKRGTQDSIRKNFFVDFHRMGFINRFDINGKEILPFESTQGKTIKYVSLTELGVELINNKKDIFKKQFIYTKGIDLLSHGLANDLLDIMIELDDNYLTIHEFMFFVSYMGQKLRTHTYTRSEVIEFIRDYRSMSAYQKLAVIDEVQCYCDPNKFVGNKTVKRDYHNWRNEAMQIFMLMGQTVLFEQGIGKEKDILKLKIGKNALFDSSAKLIRSKKAKEEYFTKHNVSKQIGFELHHIIPLLMARNKLEFDALDVWENLIYIDGYTHSKITQTDNKNIVISFENNSDIKLETVVKRSQAISCVNGKHVIYNVNNIPIMESFNNNMLNSFGYQL